MIIYKVCDHPQVSLSPPHFDKKVPSSTLSVREVLEKKEEFGNVE
jgi:hypothetical protein